MPNCPLVQFEYRRCQHSQRRITIPLGVEGRPGPHHPEELELRPQIPGARAL